MALPHRSVASENEGRMNVGEGGGICWKWNFWVEDVGGLDVPVPPMGRPNRILNPPGACCLPRPIPQGTRQRNACFFTTSWIDGLTNFVSSPAPCCNSSKSSILSPMGGAISARFHSRNWLIKSFTGEWRRRGHRRHSVSSEIGRENETKTILGVGEKQSVGWKARPWATNWAVWSHISTRKINNRKKEGQTPTPLIIWMSREWSVPMFWFVILTLLR